MINGDCFPNMAKYYLNGLFLSLAQKSEVPISILAERDNTGSG